jgi:hypothetical protein
MKRFTLLFILIVFLAGCTQGTIGKFIKDQDFQKDNFPLRELKVIIYLDPSNERHQIEKLIKEASNDMFKQVGISLSVIKWESYPYRGRNWKFLRDDLSDRLDSKWKDFDVAILFSSYSPLGFLMANTIGNKAAVIENSYRRIIIIKQVNLFILEHELWHCFVLSTAHGYSGILMPMAIKILPFTPMIPLGGYYLTKNQRQEVLNNKWRDFSKIPLIPETHRADLIKPK